MSNYHKSDCSEALELAIVAEAFRKGFYAGFAESAEGSNAEYPFQAHDMPIVGDPRLEAALEAALQSMLRQEETNVHG